MTQLSEQAAREDSASGNPRRPYMVTSFCFFLFAGLLALAMRAELAQR